MNRKSGILMPIFALPGRYGIGTFGKKAYEFADFLKKAGQSYWQILPLGPTSYGDSPYQAFSAFAGNPYFIDLEILIEEGLLEREVCDAVDFGEDENSINYSQLFKERMKVLEIAYRNAKGRLDSEIKAFEEENKEWLEDYALFMAIKDKMNLVNWQEWDLDIKLRTPEALAYYKERLKEEIRYWVFIQYEFFKQWKALKSYVNRLGVKIIGDMPIYVAGDSADAWARAEMFKLDKKKQPKVVAGCPPDAFSSDGQLWGNPIYDWDYLEKTQYSWWIKRTKESLKLYDWIRIDHFRGFEAYWEVPAQEKTAKNGKWVKGPGMKLFNQIKAELGEVNIIAEDLGYLTEQVRTLRDTTGYPGMKVLQFAFDTGEESDYLPHNYDKNCIVYTGTHDNDTIIGWLETTGIKEEIKHAKQYLRLDHAEGYHWGFIRGAWSSVARIAITQMQDILGLGNEARINFPSTSGQNWKWRMQDGSLSEQLAKKLYDLTKMYGRLGREDE